MESKSKGPTLINIRQRAVRLGQTLILCLWLSVAVFLSCATTTTLNIQRPTKGEPVRITGKRTVKVPPDSHILARTGFDPLVIPSGDYSLETKQWIATLAAIRGDRLQPLIGQWNISGPEPRCTLGDAEPFVVIEGSASLGYGSEIIRAMPLRDMLAGKGENDSILLPTGFRSPLVLRAGSQVLATGYTYEKNKNGAATFSSRKGVLQAQNLAIYNISEAKPVLLGMVESFSEHAENNLASGVTADGIVHLLATQVFISEGNHSWVHYLRFDPMQKKWLGDSLLFTRQEFTSTITPRLVASGSTVDAFWLPDGGSETLPTDGLYANRIGEPITWRLTETKGEYAILPNADGHGALLIGVAEKPSEDGKIRWFVRRGNDWTTAGETDLGELAYTLNTSGTDPFGLWRDASGIHAAFITKDGITIADLRLP